MKIKNFAPKITANSGQVFRTVCMPNEVHFISGKEYAIVKNDGDTVTTDDNYFENYFDAKADYCVKNLPPQIINECKGMKILRGDFAELAVSFIISANNNINRIKKTIEALCQNCGEQKTFGNISYYAFPSLDKLMDVSVEKWKSFGCGYRVSYLMKAVRELQSMPFENLQNLNNKELYKRIITLSGVGDKVARCIMLFAFHRLNIAPVDTWMLKAAGKFINTKNKTPKHIAVDLQKYFGEYAGVAQQYIFYYTQFLKKDIINCD